MKKTIYSFFLLTAIVMTSNCSRYSCHDEMLALLESARKNGAVAANTFHSSAKLLYVDSLLALPHRTPAQIAQSNFLKAHILMELGREKEAIELFEDVATDADSARSKLIAGELAIAYLRKGERDNCIMGHEAESCILPIQGLGIHERRQGSLRAIEHYQGLLTQDTTDLEARWLLNIAYMTLGEYPHNVPKEYLLPGMEGDTAVRVKPFTEIAAGVGLGVNDMAGGTIVDDFDNDGYYDIITSSMELDEPMTYFRNNADGTFSNLSRVSGIGEITGGLNIMQVDYDNDGDKDVFVVRGAWKGKHGCEPNSLLENIGNGKFKDVTTISGLLSFHPTQTATWNDFNNDGWLDVFIGNESTPGNKNDLHPCELYISNGDKTFTNIAQAAKVQYTAFVKGVTSGDYDNDGWQDIFISTMNDQRILLKNYGKIGKHIMFENVSKKAGITERGNSFPTWFWDYDNDGWLDIFVCDYSFRKSLSYYAAAEKLGIPTGNPNKMWLYRNNKDGTFTNIANETGLNKVTFAMAANFGDINNDGFLDMYLGTGDPSYQSVIPNKMFLNLQGERFADVTTSARVGHLQKGHGVAFADMDNDGDQDIYIDMGGAFKGDAYQSAFFLNPGQSNNNWIGIDLQGVTTNRDAIGTRVKVSFTENGVSRSVYRDVNSGGSFGSSPLRREIGIGSAEVIDTIEIQWHGTKNVQKFRNIQPNQVIRIVEGKEEIETIPLRKLEWKMQSEVCLPAI